MLLNSNKLDSVYLIFRKLSNGIYWSKCVNLSLGTAEFLINYINKPNGLKLAENSINNQLKLANLNDKRRIVVSFFIR